MGGPVLLREYRRGRFRGMSGLLSTGVVLLGQRWLESDAVMRFSNRTT